MSKQKPLYTLYNSLKANHYDVPSDYDLFERTLTQPDKAGAAARRRLHQSLKENSYDVPDDYESFYSTLFEPISSTTSRARGSNATPMTWGERAAAVRNITGMVADTNAALQRGKKQREYAKSNAGLKPKPVKIGENSHIVETKPKFDANSGMMKQTYLTESGNEYDNRIWADFEQNQTDAYKRSLTLDGQLEAAEQEQERLEKLVRERIEEINKSKENNGFFSALRDMADESHGIPGGVVNDNGMRDYRLDDRYLELEAAARKNSATLQVLRDKRDGKMNDFWHTMGTTLTNGYTFSDGLSDINDAIALQSAQKHLDTINKKRASGQPLTKEEEAAEAVLFNSAKKDQVQGLYGGEYGVWATAGGMFANSIDLMKDIVLTPGAAEIAKGTASFITKGLGKGLTKIAGEKLSQNLIMRGVLKGTGILIGSHTAGAVVSNTAGIGHTLGKMGSEMVGNVAVDNEGDYKIENQKDLLHAFVEAERQQIGENGSEMFGEFIPGIGGVIKKGLDKIGLSRISGALTNIGKKEWFRQYGALLQRGGYSGIPGEAMEEYEGMLFDAMTGNAEEVAQQMKDPRTHVDIWLGTLTMGALLGAAPMVMQGYSTGQYYRYKLKVAMSDKAASIQMPAEKWQSLRDKIDVTENGAMADVVVNDIIKNDELNPQEKKAALDYVRNLQRMRGFNIAQANNSDEEKDPTSQAANEAYSQGRKIYEGQNQQAMHDAKNMLDYRKQKMQDAFGINEGDIDTVLGEDPVAAIDAMRDTRSPEQIKAATDYLNAKATWDGMIAHVQDDITDKESKANADIDARVNKTTGMITPATMKYKDRKVYIVGGNVARFDYGSMVDEDNSDESVIIRDAETGKIEMVSPADIFKVEQAIDPVEEKERAQQEIRESVAQEAANKIDGTLAFGVNDTYTILDDDGQQHNVTIVQATDENGLPIELPQGQVAVSVDGAEATIMPADAIQQGADQYNLARLQQYEQQQMETEAAIARQEHETTRPVYQLNDEVTLRDENGLPVRGSITAPENEDGLIEVYTESPIGGNKVNMFTRDQLDGMLIQQNGVEVEQPVETETTAEEMKNSGELQDNGNNGAENIPENGNIEDDNVPQRAIDRIPTVQDKDGKTVRQWEQAEPADTYDALNEIYGDEQRTTKKVGKRIDNIDKQIKAVQKQIDKLDDSDDFDADFNNEDGYQKLAQQKSALEAQKKYWQSVQRIPQDRRNEASRLSEEERKQAKAERIAAEQAAAEQARIDRERTNGVPDVTSDKAEDAASGEPAAQTNEPTDSGTGVKGDTGEEVAKQDNLFQYFTGSLSDMILNLHHNKFISV